MSSIDHERKAEFLLARLERRVLQRLAGALPPWMTPDQLTVIGIVGSTLVGAGYLLSNEHENWLLLACAGLAINWFGDSLDGTVARFRHIERPRYGFYLDHLTDAYSTIAIGVGLGLSPYMNVAVGLTIAVAYLVLSINVYLETLAFGRFTFSYGAVGPTEVRILLILLNVAALVFRPLAFPVFDVTLTAFDVAGLAIVAGMGLLLASRVTTNLRTLAALEPARRSADQWPDVGEQGDEAVRGSAEDARLTGDVRRSGEVRITDDVRRAGDAHDSAEETAP